MLETVVAASPAGLGRECAIVQCAITNWRAIFRPGIFVRDSSSANVCLQIFLRNSSSRNLRPRIFAAHVRRQGFVHKP